MHLVRKVETPLESWPPQAATGHARLPLSTIEDFQKCANCHKDGSTLVCSRCHVTGVGQLQVSYCSSECQKADWPSHKRICRPRQEIARAASILYDLWKTFEVKTWTRDASIIRHGEGFVHTKHDVKDMARRCLVGQSIFRSFPENFHTSVSEEVKLAVLFDQSCAEPIYTGFDILKMFLEPIALGIDQVSTMIKDPALVVSFEDDPLDECYGNHEVIRVTLPSTETFVIDITGAQYGWREKLSTWETFSTHRTLVNEPGNPLGSGREFEAATYSAIPLTQLSRVVYSVRQELAKGLANSLEEHIQASTAKDVKGLLSLPNAEFLVARQKLMEHAEKHLHDSINNLLAKGVGRYYYDKCFSPCATDNEQEYQKLKGVWLRREEVARFDSDRAAKRFWSQRMSRAQGN